MQTCCAEQTRERSRVTQVGLSSESCGGARTGHGLTCDVNKWEKNRVVRVAKKEFDKIL